jgi:mRNA interferase RelE/StbE
MLYRLTIRKSAIRSLEKINDPAYSEIKNKIYSLASNPRPSGYKKLKGRPGYRVRSGDYRIIYDIFDTELVIDVIQLGHRKDVYDK